MDERDSAPAAHNQDLGVHHAAPDAPAATADDLDALVARAKDSHQRDGHYGTVDSMWPLPNLHDELCEAITDLRAQLADKQRAYVALECHWNETADARDSAYRNHSLALDRVARLEAANAEARELLGRMLHNPEQRGRLLEEARAFLAK